MAKSKYETHVLPNLDKIIKWAKDGATAKKIADNLHIAYSTFRKYLDEGQEGDERYAALSAAFAQACEVPDEVDLGLLSGLGLAQYGLASPQEDEEEPEPVRGDTEDGTASMALVIAQTERDTYKRMYESLLARMTMEREETA